MRLFFRLRGGFILAMAGDCSWLEQAVSRLACFYMEYHNMMLLPPGSELKCFGRRRPSRILAPWCAWTTPNPQHSLNSRLPSCGDGFTFSLQHKSTMGLLLNWKEGSTQFGTPLEQRNGALDKRYSFEVAIYRPIYLLCNYRHVYLV